MDRNTAEKRLAKSYTALGGKSLAIPWAAIIQMILGLIGGCTVKRAKAWGRKHPDQLEDMLRGELKEQTSLAPKDVSLVAQAGVSTFNSASVSDIRDLTNS